MTDADKADSEILTTPARGNDQSAAVSQIDREQIERLIGRSQLLFPEAISRKHEFC